MKIRSNIRDYEVTFAETAQFINNFKRFQQCYYVIDENVWHLYKNSLLQNISLSDHIVIPISEDRKSLDTVHELYDRLIVHPAKRNLTLISIGGGILQDLTGFAASTLYRGINWVFVPTTLLAQADSCIGSKTSLNYRGFKNLIGTFYPPSEVFIYTPFLKTQENMDFFSGLGEVLKLHLIGGAEKFNEMIKLMPMVMERRSDALLIATQNSLKIKHQYISDDEFDTGKRNILNFGHCFGHALEHTSHFEIPHGQAVIIGILIANIIAKNRALLSKSLQASIAEELLLPGLVAKPRKHHLNPNDTVEAMKKDKKRTDERLALIMMKSNYEMLKVNDLAMDEVAEALADVSIFLNIH